MNPEDDILVKGYKILRRVRFQLSQTWNWEIRSHSFEFMLSPKLVDRAHIWVLLFRLWNLKKFKFGALCLLHPVLCCHFQASHHPFSHCRDGSSLRRVKFARRWVSKQHFLPCVAQAELPVCILNPCSLSGGESTVNTKKETNSII